METKNPGGSNYSLNSANSSNMTFTTTQNYWSQNPWVQPYWVQPYVQPLVHIIQVPIVQTVPVYVPAQRTALNKQPEAHITVNKSRTKLFGNNVYIQDETEFELELFNPSNETLGVKFKINGNYISDNHFVLYPGKHMFLDRYLNENKKFKYVTYTVDDNKESKEAIVNNGLIEIEFYREYVSNTVDLNKKINERTIFGSPDNSNIFRMNSSTNTVNLNSMTIGTNINYCNIGTTTNYDSILTTTNNDPMIYENNTSINNFYDSSIKPCLDWTVDTSQELKDEIETGMITKGSKSDTEFDEVDINFEMSYVTLKTFKILPLSQKPIEAKDLIPKCNICQLKMKKDSNFCSNCGSKL